MLSVSVEMNACFSISYSKRMTAKKCLEHSWLTKAKKASARLTAKAKGKKKSDSCCESLSSTDSPYDISQDSTSSLDVSPLSSASSSFSPAAGKPSDDEILSTTPVKSSSLDEKVISSQCVENNGNNDVENLVPKKLSNETIRNSVKEKSGESVKKSSPISTPTGSFGSSRSVKSSSTANKKSPSSVPSTDNAGVSKSTSDPTVVSLSDVGGHTSTPHSQSTTNTNNKNASADTSQVVMRRQSRAKVSTNTTNKNGEVKRCNKVNPESLPNYSRDSYRRNSMNFGESTDLDVMDFLRNGLSPSTASKIDYGQPSPSSQLTPSGSTSSLHPITETSGKASLRSTCRDKSPKISFDAQMALLEMEDAMTEQGKKSGEAAEVFQCPPSPKIPMEAIKELQTELKIGWVEKLRRPSDEQKKSTPTMTDQSRSRRASSPKISMEAIRDILQTPDCEIKIDTTADTHDHLKRKHSEPKEQELYTRPKNLERTTEWKTLPRRHSSAKPSYIVQSKPINREKTKPSYNPTGPFQFLPNPNSRLVDRRGSLPINAVGGKLYGLSSSSQLSSFNDSRSSHNSTSSSMERSTTPLSFYNASNPSSRSNSPLHCSSSYTSCRTTLSSPPSKVSHWKSCEELDN